LAPALAQGLALGQGLVAEAGGQLFLRALPGPVFVGRHILKKPVPKIAEGLIKK
jgi:hypothetical protein